MNKKFIVAWLATFIAWMFGSFVVHGVLLYEQYSELPNLFRGEADSQAYFPFMLLAHVLMAGALVRIYARGVEAKPWLGQGLRFGVTVALLTALPGYMIYYAVQPLPGALVVGQIVCDSALIVLLGVLVAFLHRQPASA
jgi:multisubunit Na+/H+ antiporter MnhC subunit